MEKLIIFLVVCALQQVVFAQNCEKCRYITPIYDSVTVETVQFAAGENAQGSNQDLFMDIYQPYGDTVVNRPVFIFAFGGAFIKGDRTDGYVISACERLAKSGYVTVAIDYRIGFDVLSILQPDKELMRVFFRAMQDMRASVQYMKASATELGNPYSIDTTKIFISGASAGAITALMVAYCDKSTELMEIADTSAIATLGGFHSSSGIYPNYNWNVAGVLSIAGALVNADWIESGDVPVLSSQGDKDNTVPYKGGNFNLGFMQIGLEGSFLVDSMARVKGVCSYLHTMYGQDHPSGSADAAYFDNIFNRVLPRMQAIIYGRTFCCDLSVSVAPDSINYISPGQSATMDATVSNDFGNATISWCTQPCGFTGSGAQIIDTPVIPSYYITTVTEDSCQNTDFVIQADGTVGFVDKVALLGVVAYPNPANTTLHFYIPQGDYSYLEVLDMKGNLVAKIFGKITLGAASTFDWDASGLSAGSYIYSLKSREGSLSTGNIQITRK